MAILLFVIPFVVLVIIAIGYDKIIPFLSRQNRSAKKSGWYKILKGYYILSLFLLPVGLTYFSNKEPTALIFLISVFIIVSGIVFIHIRVFKIRNLDNENLMIDPSSLNRKSIEETEHADNTK